MTNPCSPRTPHGLFVQLIPQYFEVAGECLTFTEEGAEYYSAWYAAHGLPFISKNLTLARFKLDLLKMAGETLLEAEATLEHDAAAEGLSGLPGRALRAVLQADFAKAATYADLAEQARCQVVVVLPRERG
jgi:hypothetical protein